MDEEKEGEFEEEFDENGFDPTKEAFFSDLMEMEEDIASEAYDLVEHAMNLIESKYYDDAIEILRQAIALYTQINREEEIRAINEKISEVYVLKEQEFREVEILPEEIIKEFKEEKVEEEIAIPEEKIEPVQEIIEADLVTKAERLIIEAQQLVEANEFEGALDKYDGAIEIFEEMDNRDEVDKTYKLIEDCYNKKADYLRSLKKVTPSEVVSVEIEQGASFTEEELKDEKLKQYLISKKREEELSSKAYELLGQATELAKSYQHDQALKLYEEGARLFQELNWSYEVKRVQDTIAQLEKEKLTYLQGLERQKAARKKKVGVQPQQVDILEKDVKEREEHEKAARMEKVRDLELQKMEIDFFKAQIDNMVTEASRMAREYELAMQKAIKKGEMIEDCVYPKVIEIYKKIMELLTDKGWRSEAGIYESTINVYLQKLEQDKKIRQIEAEKRRKQKEVEETLKVKKEEEIPTLSEEQLKVLEEQRRRETEIQKIKEKIDEMTNRAERLAREYEVALRKGRFELKCPYPEIINIYKNARRTALEKGLETDAAIFLSQIQAYTEKLEKDKKLRQIEAEKAKKQLEVEEILKVKEEEVISLDEEKLRRIEEQKKLIVEEEEFDELINDIINKAEKMAREYDLAMKKAVREGKLAENPPFEETIKIYDRAKQMVLAKGKQEDAAIYANQIRVYTEKLENDRKLREVEAQKIQKQKAIEEIHKVGKKVEIDEERLRVIERKKEEEEFEKFISDMVDKAESLVRDHEIATRKAIRKGEIPESTPYLEVIEIYKQIREKVIERGWEEQGKIFTDQIKIYRDKLEKHKKLLEVEAQKEERQKDIEEMHRIDRTVEIDEKRLKTIERKKEEKEFEKLIASMVNKAEKLERDHDSAIKKALKKGEIIEKTPYPEIIEIYKEIREKVLDRGWAEQSTMFSNQIKIYQDKLEKHEKLLEVEAQKAEKQKEIEEMHKMGKKELKPYKPEKVKEIEEGYKEEDLLLDKAMGLIDEAERSVKNYKLSIKTEVLLYESPYDSAIKNYKNAQKLFKEIGWNDEANRLIKTIKFYEEKKEKDDRLREIEKKKLEEPETELIAAKADTEKELLAREKKILEFEKKKEEEAKLAEQIFDKIHNAERMAQEYELKIKEGIFKQEAPYGDILKIYRDARKSFEEIGWMEESMKLINTIQFYKEKLEKDKKLRAIEIEKVKKQEQELLMQQRLLEQARVEQERLLEQKEESLLLRKEKVSEFESVKDKAFNLMDLAKNELKQMDFDKAVELYEESGKIFSDIDWQEGINMVKDSITMIKRRKKTFELEQEAIEERIEEKRKIEEKLEERLAKAEELRKLHQEEKRKEFLKIQAEKEWEREISEEAYDLLEQGTFLLDRRKFNEAYDKYIAARKLFQKISWQREISRINNELLFKLKRERKQHEILEDLKKKKVEEEKKMEALKKEADKERKELEKRKKEEKRELAKAEIGRKITKRIKEANKLIENFRYNEAILVLKEEIKRLKKLGKQDDIAKISDQINEVIAQAQIPLITLEELSGIENFEKFELAYKAMDKAQVSLTRNRFMKAISELNEAKFNLENLKIGKKFINDIEQKINEFRAKLGKGPEVKVKIEEDKDAMERLRTRITKRREERRKKVLELLKKK